MRLRELYQEEQGNTFTHDDVEYDLNLLFAIMDKAEIHMIPIDELDWVITSDERTDIRTKAADTTAPVLVTWWGDVDADDHKLVVLDGAHRVAKARSMKLEYIPGKYVDVKDLLVCRLSK